MSEYSLQLRGGARMKPSEGDSSAAASSSDGLASCAPVAFISTKPLVVARRFRLRMEPSRQPEVRGGPPRVSQPFSIEQT